MIDELLFILEYIATNTVAQVLLGCTIALLAITFVFEMISIRRRRRRDSAFFAPPIDSVKEIFPANPAKKKQKVFVSDQAHYAKSRAFFEP